MKLSWFLGALLTISSLGLCIDCSVKELKQYNFESIKGIHSISLVRDTPPSETNTTWYFGICDTLDKITACPKNSDVCGITTLKVDKDPKKIITSEIIGFNSNLEKLISSINGKDNEQGVSISYTGSNWGNNLVDANLDFYCPEKNDKATHKFEIISWDGKKLHAKLTTKAACITSDKDKKKGKQPDQEDDNGESWGWFTWIFIFMVLFLSIYIVGGAWFQYHKGNSIDFQSALKEVLENFIDLLRGLPSFIREIIEKFTGNSDRGEYSAV
ncbi:uncharacterized protein PRCAT00004530001 [Priceomyces carsonii]|uniref:uncharacterized protein n=1 Tax=Priceomyces carsonii TaxID=28549 RepID=UPI002ED8A7B7|nr:unnamed protein product [Priceomyces carsonii]